MGILSSEKFKPTLFVGLGGNGGKIINQLAFRLKRHPNWSRTSDLTHFVAIDTNKHDLDSLKALNPDCRFLVSNFDARSYVERKHGKQELPVDPLFTQWYPEGYVPRSGMTPGAGQIRLESRLKLWYNLEEDRAGLRRKVMDIFEQMTARDNPWRDNEDRVIRVMIYGSVAGGTGSGGFIPMAYLLRQWVEAKNWGRPNVVGVLSLPTTFLNKVKPELHKDIEANGYAALKELEFLTRQLGYANGMDALDFHYDPSSLDRSTRVVRDRPFTLVYLVDQPDRLSIDKYEHAVADASYLQIFSPLLGAQAGEYDNYEKHQRQLALGHFSVHFGSFGSAILHLPRKDLLRYASLRFVARALREYLCFGGDHPDFRVPYGDPAFERQNEAEKNKRIDAAFEGYVAFRAQQEEEGDERGVFTQVHEQTAKGGVQLRPSMGAVLADIYGRLDELIDIPDVERTSINQGNPSLSRAMANLRQAYGESRARVRGQYLEAQLADLKTGRFFGRFFTKWEVNPIAQRLFLVRLLQEDFITPFDEPSEGEFLRQDGGSVDLDGEHVRSDISRLENDLRAQANQSMLKKLTDRDNKAFNATKTRAVRTVTDLADDCRDDLRRYFWRTFESELRSVAENMLASYRKVAEISDNQARLAEEEAERFRKDPASFPDSELSEYYLDAEVLRDDRRKDRLWDVFFLHHLDKSAYFDTKGIFATVTEAFQPARDPDGRLRPRDAGEVVRAVKDALTASATTTYGRGLDDLGLDLAVGLDFEQRYIALRDAGDDLSALRAAARLPLAVSGVSRERVTAGIRDKLQRLADECVLLAHFDSTKDDDTTVTPANVFYAGLSDRFASDEEGSLLKLLEGTVTGVNFVPGWEDPDSLVLYRAKLGVPIYFYRNVTSRLYPAYRKVADDPRRSYPLHIEGSWETGLPNLDPVEIKKAEEDRRARDAALASAAQRALALREFTLTQLFGGVNLGPGGYSWVLAGAEMPLGATRAAAFDAFQALDAMLRRDLTSAARDTFAARGADRRTRPGLVEDLRAHNLRLQQLYARAIVELQDRDRDFVVEERKVVEDLIRELDA